MSVAVKKDKITKEEFDKLYSSDISKKEYDSIISRIENRFSKIINYIKTNTGWYDFDNEGGEYSPGCFDPEDYKEFIGFTGEVNVPNPYSNPPEIPTRWLWEDFEEEFHDQVEKYKKRQTKEQLDAKAKRIARKQKLAQLEISIRQKLTPEELKAIKFKKQ